MNCSMNFVYFSERKNRHFKNPSIRTHKETFWGYLYALFDFHQNSLWFFTIKLYVVFFCTAYNKFKTLFLFLVFFFLSFCLSLKLISVAKEVALTALEYPNVNFYSFILLRVQTSVNSVETVKKKSQIKMLHELGWRILVIKNAYKYIHSCYIDYR